MQAGKIVAGMLGLMVVAACGAPATVAPTPLNPVALQGNTMQSYGPGSAVSTASTASQTITDSAPAIATGEDTAPTPKPSTAPSVAPAAAADPQPEPSASAAVPIMDTGSGDVAPKQTLWQKAKTGASNLLNKAMCLFKKDC